MFELWLVVALVATFGTIALGGVALDMAASERRRAVRLLESHVKSSRTASARDEELSVPIVERLVVPFMARAVATARRVTPVDTLDRIAHKLALAGNPPGWDAERVAAVKLIGAGGGALFGLLLLSGAGGPLGHLALTALCAAVGFVAPNVILGGRAQRRQQAMWKALADTMDLLSISVEAGLGFDAALQEVTKHVPGPLSQEIRRMLQEMQLGVGRAEAFRQLADRTDIEELRSFALAMVQADAFGIPIANVLRAQSHEIRTKRRQRAEEEGMKVPVKILFPLILCVLPALFVVILGPGVIQIYRSFIGI